MYPIKYPKTPHLSFSPGVNIDDDILLSNKYILDTHVIITEKMDGGNFQYFNGEIYARTVQNTTSHPSFSVVKQQFSGMKGLIPKHFAVYGENMQAIHSIEYSELSSYYYIFAIFDHKNQMWLSWKDVVKCADYWGLPTVPLLFEGTFQSEDEIEKWIKNRMKEGSSFGEEMEGVVLRCGSSFRHDAFSNYVCKYVRSGHVQTDTDWKKTWKQCVVVKDL